MIFIFQRIVFIIYCEIEISKIRKKYFIGYEKYYGFFLTYSVSMREENRDFERNFDFLLKN